MYVCVNFNKEIKKIGISTSPELVSLYVDENNDLYPFKGWSEAKICCYRVEVKDGVVMMLTPYVDSRLIDHFDQVGQSTEINKSDITDNRDGLMETFETGMTNSDDITTLRDGLMEVYEMITAESEVQ